MNNDTTNETPKEIPYGYCHCGCGQKTGIAKRNEYRRGHVKGEPLRFVHGHNPRLGSYADRFWPQVHRLGPDECWEWQGCTDSFGYGRIHIGSGSQSFLTHRIAYELTNGPIPDGLIICHKCDNPPCCNPAHFFLGTRTDNMTDKVAKDRQPRGASHAHAKLTEEQVADARRRYAQGGTTVTELARAYDISYSSISDMLRRKTWRHIA